MTTISIPEDNLVEHASDTNYSVGPATGTPTKVDPGAGLMASGIIPGSAYGAQHVNYILNKLSLAADAALQETRRNFANRALKLRLLSSASVGDTQNSLAAVSGLNEGSPAIVMKVGTNDVSHVWDWSTADPAGTLASITSQVCGAARNGSRIIAIGTGGNRACFSTDEGDTWTACDDLGATPQDIVFSAAGAGRYVVSFAAGATVSHDTTGVDGWTNVASGLTSAQGGLAVLSSGVVVMCGLDGSGDIDFALSSDAGVSWSVAGGTVPNPGDYDDAGWVCGNTGSLVFHVGRVGADLRVCSSPDGTTWTLIATLTPRFSSLPNPRIRMCQETGLLVIVFVANSTIPSTQTYASADAGQTWSEPMQYAVSGAPPVAGFAVANGRLFATIGAALFASDGIGRV